MSFNWICFVVAVPGLALLGLLIVVGTALYMYRRLKSNGYIVLGRGTPGRSEPELPPPGNWEEIELQSAMASMEATTIL